MDIMKEANQIAKKVEKEEKKAQRQKRMERAIIAVGDCLNKNGATIAFLVPIGIAAVNAATVFTKTVERKQKKDSKELHCYDRSAGHYWSLRRKPTNKEWIEVNKRKGNGEKMGDILSELKLLK